MPKQLIVISLNSIMILALIACKSPITQQRPSTGPDSAKHSQNVSQLEEKKTQIPTAPSNIGTTKLDNRSHQYKSPIDIPQVTPQIAAQSTAPNRAGTNTESKTNKTKSLPIQMETEINTAPLASRSRKQFDNSFAKPSVADLRMAIEPTNREKYAHIAMNPVQLVSEVPVSTFSIDVDTGSYTNVRRILRQGQLPVKDAVRAEEFINYFSYPYPSPANEQHAFEVATEMGPTPWNSHTALLNIGINGFNFDPGQRPDANLVFLVDVSGSMQANNKLELLKNALKLLSNQLTAGDRIAMVVYAGASGIVLEPTAGNEKLKIQTALDQLTAGGSTNGAAGIRLAYATAQQNYISGGINRILLATDGDFNVGTTNFEALKNLVEEKRQSGISLTTLGFGAGNYNDHLMEQLADAGNGNYSYIDTLNEAQKVLVDEMGSTLHTIAKDVKIQIEFNPAVVAEYRLIGYENRKLKREDFNNDKVDAGEIGAGHTVTALYELSLVGGKGQLIEPLRYKRAGSEQSRQANTQELAFLRLRYKQPEGNTSQLIERPLKPSTIISDLAQTSNHFRFAASVAAFAQLLRGGTYINTFDYDKILELARQSRANDPFGYRSEFISMVNLAKSLAGGNNARSEKIVHSQLH